MPQNTITFRMEGENINLSDFSITMRRLHALLQALSNELAPTNPRVQWDLQNLSPGSATVTLEGISTDQNLPVLVAHGFVTIGQALSTGSAIPFSTPVRNKAEELISVLDGSVRGLVFEADQATARVTTRAQLAPSRTLYSLGELRGTVQTLTKQGQRRFTLYDSIFNRAVRCFFASNLDEKVRSIWGNRVSVVGRIGRDRLDGHPIEVRDIQEITLLTEPETEFDFNQAFGILDLGDESPEVLVRRLRDAD